MTKTRDFDRMPVCPKCHRGRLARGLIKLAPANSGAREWVEKFPGAENNMYFTYCRDCDYRGIDLAPGDIIRSQTSASKWRVVEVVK